MLFRSEGQLFCASSQLVEKTFLHSGPFLVSHISFGNHQWHRLVHKERASKHGLGRYTHRCKQDQNLQVGQELEMRGDNHDLIAMVKKTKTIKQK